jgi:hypothetical protein
MLYNRKGSTSTAFRYFLFILLVCIVLFVFLMSRLAEGIETEIDYEGYIAPTYQAVQWTPTAKSPSFNAAGLRPTIFEGPGAIPGPDAGRRGPIRL